MMDVQGVAQAVAKFLVLAKASEVTAEAAAAAGAAPVEAVAKAIVPYDTGALEASIHIESRKEGAVGVADVIAGDSSVDYAAAVEFTEDGQPFMRPAADQAEDEAERAVATVVLGVLR